MLKAINQQQVLKILYSAAYNPLPVISTKNKKKKVKIVVRLDGKQRLKGKLKYLRAVGHSTIFMFRLYNLTDNKNQYLHYFNLHTK